MTWLGRGGLHVAIIGASGGIGGAFADALCAQNHRVWALSRREGALSKARWLAIDLEDEASIASAAGQIEGELDLVIVATGLLSDGEDLKPEKSWRALDGKAMARLYAINTIGPALCAKHFLPKLPRQRRAVFAALSARVGSIADNRLGGWHSYRASKAALNMLLKTCAIELRVRHKQALCIGLHPGTVDTSLSSPFQAYVRPEKLFEPAFSAAQMLDVIEKLEPDDSGKIFDFAGQQIPY